MIWLKQSTAATVPMGPFVDDTDFKTVETALSLTQVETRLSKNGGAFAQKNDATTASHLEEGTYGIVLDATDTNTLGRLRIQILVTGALIVWQDFMVVPANVYDSLVGGSDTLQADVQQWIGSAPNALIAGRVDANAQVVGDKAGYSLSAAAIQAIWDVLTSALTTVGSIGKLLVDNINATISSRSTLDAAGVRAAVGLASANLDTQLATIDDFLDTEIADILLDTGTTLDDFVDDLELRLTAALATALQAHGLGIGRGVVTTGSTTTSVVFSTVNDTTPSAVNDFYNGRHIVFTSGALALQATSITDYDGTTKAATVPAVTSAPANGDTFIIV